MRAVLVRIAVFTCTVFLPAIVFGQGAIGGVVRDTSGGILPGVTVEAASDALIEKVRAVVTDDSGQYLSIDVQPGTYSVIFMLPGFVTLRREGLALSAGLTLPVNASPVLSLNNTYGANWSTATALRRMLKLGVRGDF